MNAGLWQGVIIVAEENENEKKKKYLKGYQGHVRRISRIEEELAELRSMKEMTAVSIDGMPHGSTKSDLSDYVSELDRLERKLLEERHQRILAYKSIAGQIKKLVSENEKDVLFYRYIRGLDWWEIAEKMRYSERWVIKLHEKAITDLKLPKEFIEVQ